MPRFAANVSTMFGEVDFLDRFAAAADCGFRAVECQFPYAWPAREVARRLAASGLVQALINAPPGAPEAGDRGLAALPGRRGEFRAGFARALDYAGALDCPLVHAMAGVAPPGADRAAMTACFVDNLAWAAERAAAQGVRVLIEPLNACDAPGYFLGRLADAREILAAAGAPRLAIQCDLYHLQMTGGNLAATVAEFLPHIGHVQIAGVPGRHEPDNGEIAYPFLFDLLDSLGYEGWVGCEYTPAGATRDGLGWARGYGIGPGPGGRPGPREVVGPGGASP